MVSCDHDCIYRCLPKRANRLFCLRSRRVYHSRKTKKCKPLLFWHRHIRAHGNSQNPKRLRRHLFHCDHDLPLMYVGKRYPFLVDQNMCTFGNHPVCRPFCIRNLSMSALMKCRHHFPFGIKGYLIDSWHVCLKFFSIQMMCFCKIY